MRWLSNMLSDRTCSLSQSISGDARRQAGDGHNVPSRSGCRGGSGSSILDLDCKESLHVWVCCLSLGDLLSSCSPWGLAFLWLAGGVHIFFSWMPCPTHWVVPLASRRQRFVSHTSWLRCTGILGCGGGVRREGLMWFYRSVSRCAAGCCCCRHICLASIAGCGAIPQRRFLQSWDIWSLCWFCELAHSISNWVGAVELFQNTIFLLCCRGTTQMSI